MQEIKILSRKKKEFLYLKINHDVNKCLENNKLKKEIRNQSEEITECDHKFSKPGNDDENMIIQNKKNIQKIYLCILTEFCKMNLEEYISNFTEGIYYNLSFIFKIEYNLLEGLEYLHKK